MTIEKKLLPLQPFVIPVSGLAQGGARYDWRADGAFFGSFDHSEILGASLAVSVEVHPHGRAVDVDGTIRGSVTVQCDRCLEDLTLPLQTEFRLCVRTEEDGAGADGREVVLLPQGERELDLSQVVYDYVNISLPMQRVHPQGECNPKALQYLGERNAKVEEGSAAAESPFASLKELLSENNNIKR